MKEIATSKHLHIHTFKDGEEFMITNDKAAAVLKRVSLEKADVRELKILLSTIETDDSDSEKEN